jgi:hypothetical protein
MATLPPAARVGLTEEDKKLTCVDIEADPDVALVRHIAGSCPELPSQRLHWSSSGTSACLRSRRSGRSRHKTKAHEGFET